MSAPVRTLSIAAFVLVALAASVQAASYLVPSDRELVLRAEDIVLVTALDSRGAVTERGVVTIANLRVDEVLAGFSRAGETIQLIEPGGRAGGRIVEIAGSPRYEPGQRYLVFTDVDERGDRGTWGMALGRFELREDVGGRRFFDRGEVFGFDQNLEPHHDSLRDADRFVAFIRDVVARAPMIDDDYLVDRASLRLNAVNDVTASAFTRASYMLTGSVRWVSPSVTYRMAMTQPGLDGPGAVSVGVASWTNERNSDVVLRKGEQDNTALGGFVQSDRKNTILFNDPNSEVRPGVLARGGVEGLDVTYQFDGESFHPAIEGDVVFNDTFSPLMQACLNNVMAHELGHTLGIRHSNRSRNDGGECTDDCAGNAVMTSAPGCGNNGNLQAWDRTAVSMIYPSSDCERPVIVSASGPARVMAGESATLVIVATGTRPLQIDWYEGTRGDTSRPLGIEAASATTKPLTATTSFWARASNICGSAISDTIHVEVQVVAPPPPKPARSRPSRPRT